MANIYKVVCSVYAHTFKSVSERGKGKGKNNEILMGSFVKLLDEETEKWQKVYAFGVEGWIEKVHLGDSPGLKCFYVDVGQGDGALIEVGSNEDGLKIIIDGGPSDNLGRYMNKWQYKYYLEHDQKVFIDYIFISHFDKDHYMGLISIINDARYEFGAIYHNGIAKFAKGHNTSLGDKENINGVDYLTTSFDSIEDLEVLDGAGNLQPLHRSFLKAIKNAKAQNRLKHFQRIDHNNNPLIPETTINNLPFKIDVLGPVTSQIQSGLAYKYFNDSESHTVNGHSIVLKLTYGTRTFLFGGDLNIPSEDHLIDHYGDYNPFEVDVAKACHHGASEFTTEFMAKVNPLATVISSGDNESYSHPRADAIGCAGKYSRSDRPLVFSTELARSSDVKTDEVLYGMINLRCDGKKIIMAQMKEAKGGWDLYEEELNP